MKIQKWAIIFAVCCILILTIPFSAKADEPQNYVKLSCIPEIGYVEMTVTEGYVGDISIDEFSQYGLFVPTGESRTLQCNLEKSEYLVEFDFEIDGSQESPCAMTSWYHVTVRINGEPVDRIENFGNFCPVYSSRFKEFGSASAPHIIAINKYFLHHCTGIGKRECRSKILERTEFPAYKN